MAWPLASQFSAMLQNPQIAFRDPALKQSVIFKNPQGQPKPWSGAFAVVYKATLPTGVHKAIRIFSSESPERRERYEIISEYIKHEKPVNCLVKFEYLEDSIRCSDGKWYPMIIMDWVEGETLFNWVRARSLENNQPALEAAAQYWIEVVREMETAHISHGDYQHANIMVTPDGYLKLVDYDCMCVPQLVGRRNLEIGVEPYQHPQRNGHTLLSLEMDRYSALLIYISLRALASNPQLWNTYVEQPGYDKLLFRVEDIQNPTHSNLIRELSNSPQEDIREYTHLLLEYAHGPISSASPLWEIVSPFRAAEKLLRNGQWKAAVEMLNQCGDIRKAPAHLRELIDRAYKEVWREKAWHEFQNIPHQINEKTDRALSRTCNDVFLQEFEISPEDRQRILSARARNATLEKITQMVMLSHQTVALSGERALAAAGRELPSDYHYIHKKRVQQAQASVEAVDSLIQELKKTCPDDIQIVRSWNHTRKLSSTHLVPTQYFPRIQLAEERYPRLKVLKDISLKTPLDELDRQLLEIWDESLFRDCPSVTPWLKSYENALRRQVLLEKMEESLEAHDTAQIAEILKNPLMRGYPLPSRWGADIRNIAERWERSQAILESAGNKDLSAFIRSYDTRSIRENPEMFGTVMPTIQAWVEEEILQCRNNGLRPALGRGSIVEIERSGGALAIRWTWPAPRFCDTCVLALTRVNPLETDRPWEIPLLFQVELTRSEWEKMGGFYTLHPEKEWGGANIVVWGILDLGFRKFATEPLVLGQLAEKKKWFSWGR